MELLALFGLLGMGLAFSTGGGGEDEEETLEPETSETDDDPVVPVAPTEPEPVNQFVYDGSPTLIGTDGDDTLAYLDFTLENRILMIQTAVIDGGLGDDYIEAGFFLNDFDPSTIGLVVNGGDGDDTLSSNGIGSEFNGGDGNDLIEVAVDDTVNGGTGNDTISSTGGSVVDGGTGDDVLTGQHGDTHFGGAGNDVLSGASSMSGGDGNDTISGYYELSGGNGDDLLTSYANPYAAGDGDALVMSGDAGNDTLTASADFGYDNTPSVPGSYLGMSGGEDADVFDVQITMPGEGSDAYSLEDVERDTFLNIVDFNPDEDVLTVQINGNEDSNVEMTSAEIVLRDFADVGTAGPVLEQAVQLNFAATETTGTFSTWVRVHSDVEITINDIEFVAGPGVIMGEVLTIPDDGSDIIGTDGNDTLTSEYTTDEDLYRDVGNIRLGDGDDLVDIPLYGPNIEGGLGNDTITFTGIDGSVSGGGGDDLIEAGTDLSTLNGDEGNDTLIGNYNNNLYGGAGDDLLIGEVIDYHSGSFVIDGGAGDDTIMFSTDIGYPADAIPATSVTGGEGADSIELLLKMNGGYYGDFPSTSDTERATGIYLDDFNADEDSLVIQIDRAEGNEDRVMTGAEIVTTTNTVRGVESSQSSINMYFAATDIYGEHTAVIRLGDDVNISIDDVVFIQN